MTTEEKFNAAVNVIRNLPKNGSFQPSDDLLLRFYSYFKQATEGPCKQKKPAFWELVKKAKWQSWTNLGNMSKEMAMQRYVDELKMIIETMSFNDNVAEFLSSLDAFYESVPAEDLEMIAGDVIERIRNQHAGISNGGSTVVQDIQDEQDYDDEEDDDCQVNHMNAELVEDTHLHNGGLNIKTDLEEPHRDTDIEQAFMQDIHPTTYSTGTSNYSGIPHNVVNNSLAANSHDMYDDSTEAKVRHANEILKTIKILHNNVDQVMVRIAFLREQVLRAKIRQRFYP